MTAKQTDIATEISQGWATATDWVSTHTTQIGVSILLGAAIVAALYMAKLLGQWLCRAERADSRWLTIVGRTLARTRLWFMVAVAAQVIAWLGKAPAEIAWPVRALFITCVGIQTAIWARTFVLGLVERRATETDPSGNLQSAVGLIRVFVTAGLFILASILILANLGVNVTGLIAGLGIGGIAIGLAAQGIFSDLFAALSILFDKPFRKGDLIRYDQTVGEVEYIGLKSSRIRALSGEEIIISNANLLGKELRNFARLETRRVNQPLGLVYHTPLDTCAAMEAILAPAINACEGATYQRVGLETFGASSLDFMLVYDIVATDQADVLARRNAVNLAVLRALAEHKIAFAYPTQTTYTASPDGTLVMPYAQFPAPPTPTPSLKPRKAEAGRANPKRA
jgi:small-conductance mechanosensitive channel